MILTVCYFLPYVIFAVHEITQLRYAWINEKTTRQKDSEYHVEPICLRPSLNLVSSEKAVKHFYLLLKEQEYL